MNRKWIARVAAGILAVAALVLVAGGAYRAGERRGDDVEVVGEVLREGESTGRRIIVEGDGWRDGPGFFPGFFVFPLIVAGVVLLIVSRRGGWGGPGRYRRDDDEALADWHRRAHEEMAPGSPNPPPVT